MTVKICPSCGESFDASLGHCPNDGALLLTREQAVAVAPEDPTQAPAPVTRREHAPAAQAHDEHEELRDENFGKWAEPEVARRVEDPMVGRLINDRYEVLHLIGQGGMGAVYKARQPAVQRMIALKILLREFTENETVVKRFHQEAMAASRLTHPNTISVYDFGKTEDDVLYIAMEFLKGQSLAQALARGGSMPPRRAIHIMRQVCKSLAEAHEAGIIHRDLKPDNIFLTEIKGERDFVKVLDFGVAKLKEFEGKDGTLTQAGMIFGTPKYMSPEQARSGDLDARSDIYALGVILYEMLMGRPPFIGDNPLSVLIAHVNEEPRRFRHFNPEVDVPVALEAVVFKALSKDRSLRHQTAEELHAELIACDEILEGAPYESVAERLPTVLPGADGSPSVIGPAIVPDSSAGTARQRSVGPGGTVELGNAGLGVGDLDPTRDLSGTRPRRSAAPWIAIALGVPLIAAGAWFLRGADGETSPPAEVTAPPVVVDAAIARRPKDAAVKVAAAPAEAARPDAGPTAPKQVAGEPAPPAPKERDFVIATVRGTEVYDGPTGRRLGVAKPILTVRSAGPRSYILRKSGYREREITVNPLKAKTGTFDLEPIPEAARPPPSAVITPPVVKPPPTKPIDLQ